MCQYCLAPILIAKGQMKQGAKLLKKVQDNYILNGNRVHYALSDFILGEVYTQIAIGPKPSLSFLAKNIGFLVKNVPFATKKAEEHFNSAIEILKGMGALGLLGPVYLSLGRLFKATKRTDQARQCILEAIEIFHKCKAEHNFKQANKVLESLK
jgi:tetratricopeptide (TPR) repeat protein